MWGYENLVAHTILLPLVLTLLMILSYKFLNQHHMAIGAGAPTVNYLLYMFAHSGLLHLAGNSLALLLIGQQYTTYCGHLATFAVFIMGGTTAGCGSTIIKLIRGSSQTTVGASGAVFALLGALVVARFMENTIDGRFIRYVVIICVLSNVGSNIDIGCHLVGMASGALYGWSVHSMFEAFHLEKALECDKRVEQAEKGHLSMSLRRMRADYRTRY